MAFYLSFSMFEVTAFMHLRFRMGVIRSISLTNSVQISFWSGHLLHSNVLCPLILSQWKEKSHFLEKTSSVQFLSISCWMAPWTFGDWALSATNWIIFFLKSFSNIFSNYINSYAIFWTAAIKNMIHLKYIVPSCGNTNTVKPIGYTTGQTHFCYITWLFAIVTAFCWSLQKYIKIYRTQARLNIILGGSHCNLPNCACAFLL